MASASARPPPLRAAAALGAIYGPALAGVQRAGLATATYNRRRKGTALLPDTHLAISHRLCGEPLELAAGEARVALATLPEMAVDAAGLIHGGFVFGLADYAAMLAVNHPHVVLGSAEVRFLKPAAAGDLLVATARRTAIEGRKHRVRVEVARGEEVVMSGELTCFVLDRPVLGGGG